MEVLGTPVWKEMRGMLLAGWLGQRSSSRDSSLEEMGHIH